MSDEGVKITIDGKELEAEKGATIIQVADDAGIYIPRFCYHHRLPIVANCRMCLVEVEGAPKPMPACSTPVSPGMKVETKSDRAVDAQRATMEFLLINHPLDCPVCDQGGECELQDLALGFGRGVSRFNEGKRIVADEQIGPLVQTSMTRCIHCTRCIRVLEDVGGRQEIGATGRGEHMKIGTYIRRSVDSEMSGNIIDVCPVGALNSAPFNMRARGWELLAQESVSPHDCAGSNLFGHALRGNVLRVVPRENNVINDCWISDRDRFSYCGLTSVERVTEPMVRRDGKLVKVSWEEALDFASETLRRTGEGTNALISPSASLEEMYLAQKLVRGLGSAHVDSRLRQGDFRDDQNDPRFPSLGGPIQAIDSEDTVLLVGSRINKEVPILAYRLRKAARAGASIMTINPRDFDLSLPTVGDLAVHPDEMVPVMAALVHHLARLTQHSIPGFVNQLAKGCVADDKVGKFAQTLQNGQRGHVILGHLAQQHPAYADLRRLGAIAADLSNARFGLLTEGSNQAGGYLAGAVPHRGPGGVSIPTGRTAMEMIATPGSGYLLFGLEPECDLWNAALAKRALASTPVVSATCFLTAEQSGYVDCVLPIAGFGESAGSYVNVEGQLQKFQAIGVPAGNSRAGWKILTALGMRIGGHGDGFEFGSLGAVHSELLDSIGETLGATAVPPFDSDWQVSQQRGDKRFVVIREVGAYGVDPLVRRSTPLQQTRDAIDARKVWVNPRDAKEIGLSEGSNVRISSHEGTGIDSRAFFDSRVVCGTLWVPLDVSMPMYAEAVVEAVPVAAQA